MIFFCGFLRPGKPWKREGERGKGCVREEGCDGETASEIERMRMRERGAGIRIVHLSL